jgi:hypothetical protein
VSGIDRLLIENEDDSGAGRTADLGANPVIGCHDRALAT